MMWDTDAIFSHHGALADTATPVFRFTAYLPYEQAHPYLMPDRWQTLFDCFAPMVSEHCDRVVMWDRPGAKARRGKRILAGDLQPFAHLRSVHDEVASGIFIGFSFLDRPDSLEGNGRGPCSLRFFVGSSIRFEACIPLDDWTAGRLDVDALVATIQALPYISFLAGYGLSMGERADTGDAQVIDYAFRYPAVDVARDEDRAFFPGKPADFPAIGIAGINWTTGVGTPFRERAGGHPNLAADMVGGIEARNGPHGTVFRLGAHPISGEAAVDDELLPLYHTLGSRLASVYMPDEDPPRAPVFGRMAKKQSLRWERRFMLGEHGRL